MEKQLPAAPPLIISKHTRSQCFCFDYFPNPVFLFKFFPPRSVCPSWTAVLQWSTPLYQKFSLGTLKKKRMSDLREKIWCNENILCSSQRWCTFSLHDMLCSGQSSACVCLTSALNLHLILKYPLPSSSCPPPPPPIFWSSFQCLYFAATLTLQTC